jgi:thiol-disulfide isomerase/thioredoxin
MSKKTLLIFCVLFAALMVGAGALYNNLAEDVQLGGLATTPPETEAPTQAPAETKVTLPPETTEPDYSAPDFTMLDKDGNEVKLSDFLGKPIILNFWASWCGPCKSEMPDIQEFYEKYGENVHFLIVNCTDGSRETLSTAKAFIEDSGYTFPVYFDTTSMGAYTYGASSIPLTFFIDANGDLMAYYMGAMSANILQQGIDMLYTEE